MTNFEIYLIGGVFVKQRNDEEWSEDAPDFDSNSTHETPEQKRRVIDWKQPLFYPIQTAFLGVVCSLIVGAGMHYPTLAAFIMVGFLIAVPTTLAVSLMGVVFDPQKGSLTYPVYIFRRSVPLSAIKAANCQNVTTKSNTSQYAATVGEKGRTYFSKAYHVNLSGDFEARRLIFHSKYKRDQFLACLREFVPSCRVTRWS